jgi:hypothetical protein
MKIAELFFLKGMTGKEEHVGGGGGSKRNKKHPYDWGKCVEWNAYAILTAHTVCI